MLATATGGDGLSAGLAARNVSYRVNKNEAGQKVSMSFAQGEHLFEGTELSPAYSIAGMNAQITANRQAQQPQPAAQLVPVVPVVPVVSQSRAAVPEQRPVAAQPPAPELKPAPEPESPKKKVKGPRR